MYFFIPVTGLCDLEGSRISWHSAHEGGKVVTPAAFTPRNILVLIFRGWVDPGHMELSDASEKIPSDTTGYRSRNLPTSSAATPGPQFMYFKILIFLVIAVRASNAWNGVLNLCYIVLVDSPKMSKNVAVWHMS